MTTYKFQEGDAADGTSFVPFGPCRSTRQFPSSETKHSTVIWVSKLHQHDQTRGRPYHKTILVVFASRLLQIGDNQGPNTKDIGNDGDQMWHTQVVGQDGFFQSESGGHPIPRLSAL